MVRPIRKIAEARKTETRKGAFLALQPFSAFAILDATASVRVKPADRTFAVQLRVAETTKAA